jgi:hypothetical protein
MPQADSTPRGHIVRWQPTLCVPNVKENPAPQSLLCLLSPWLMLPVLRKMLALLLSADNRNMHFVGQADHGMLTAGCSSLPLTCLWWWLSGLLC